jgi:predicted PolB exonuclease-like 3'-5' exonuclease
MHGVVHGWPLLIYDFRTLNYPGRTDTFLDDEIEKLSNYFMEYHDDSNQSQKNNNFVSFCARLPIIIIIVI